MAYVATSFMHRSLTDEEEITFREWARNNYTTEPVETWHPVVLDEMNRESYRRIVGFDVCPHGVDITASHCVPCGDRSSAEAIETIEKLMKEEKP